MSITGHLRIGELSRRSGVSRELLRAWERRYGLLQPTRSDGGFRLYSSDDERRVGLMRAHLGRGVAAAEAARLAVTGGAERQAPAAEAVPAPARAAAALRAALDGLDEAGAQAAFDRLLADLTLDAVLGRVVLPYLRELGDRWKRGEASVAQEHFATGVLRGRLLGLARGWDGGDGPRAVLACAPGEHHDLGLVAFGLALRARGWRVTFLGTDTPLDTLADAVELLRPAATVVTASDPARLEGAEAGLRRLAGAAPLFVAGRSATAQAAGEAGAVLLAGDPLEAAAHVAGGGR